MTPSSTTPSALAAVEERLMLAVAAREQSQAVAGDGSAGPAAPGHAES
ncbi:MAG: hypothetical protein MUF35_09795 [Candidatus Nanopelagicales bacterium]|jgi:hypothetical protein|nr:hypothetical protein [Candidatus Nanopelagicales bacterium]